MRQGFAIRKQAKKHSYSTTFIGLNPGRIAITIPKKIIE